MFTGSRTLRAGLGFAIVLALPLVLLWNAKPLEGNTNNMFIDSNCTVSVGGRVVRARNDGSWSIPNIPAANQCPVRITGQCIRPDCTFYFRYADCVVLPQNGTLAITGVPEFSITPFSAPVRITAEADPTVLGTLGQTTQIQTTAHFADSSTQDVTSRDACTCYTSSNPAIMSVDDNGLVTANSPGQVFVTVINEGSATAVERLSFSPGDPLTTVVGIVQNEQGDPVNGANVCTFGVGGTTGADGTFNLPGVPTLLGDIRVSASSNGLAGVSDPATPVPGGITDVGIITLSSSITIAANWGNGQIHIIDLANFLISQSVQVSTSTADVDITADRTTALVASFGPSLVSFVDLTTNPPVVASSLNVGLFAEDVEIACSPSGYALVCDGGTNAPVVSIDIANRSIVNSVLFGGAQGIGVHPSGNFALSVSGSTATKIDISPAGVLSLPNVSIGTVFNAANVTFLDNGNRALIAGRSGQVGVLDTSNPNNITQIASLNLGAGLCQSIAINPAQDRAYVLHTNQISVLAIDASDNVTDTGTRITGLNNVPTYFGVEQIAVTPDGSQILARASSSLHVIDAANNTIIGTIAIPDGGSAGGIATK